MSLKHSRITDLYPTSKIFILDSVIRTYIKLQAAMFYLVIFIHKTLCILEIFISLQISCPTVFNDALKVKELTDTDMADPTD